MTSCWFIVSNHGLDGKFSGARHNSFRQHTETFFPSNADHLGGSTWRPFLDYGYIREYHNILEQLTMQWSKGKVWMASDEGVNFLTNPILYKIRCVGNEGRHQQKLPQIACKEVK